MDLGDKTEEMCPNGCGDTKKVCSLIKMPCEWRNKVRLPTVQQARCKLEAHRLYDMLSFKQKACEREAEWFEKLAEDFTKLSQECRAVEDWESAESADRLAETALTCKAGVQVTSVRYTCSLENLNREHYDLLH